MTQQAVKWIVPVPAGDPYGKETFKAVCRGNSDLGEMLNYFLFAASKEVEQKRADVGDEHITIRRNLETIAAYLQISRKTAIAYIHKLEEWKLIVAHGYRHTYDVCHHAVEEAIQNPPNAEWPKLRGKHVKRQQREDLPDCKSTIHDGDLPDGRFEPDERDTRIEALEAQIVDLQSRFYLLQSQIVELQSSIVKVQSGKSSEGASEAVGEAVFAPLIITNDSLDISNDREFVGDAANAHHEPASSSFVYRHDFNGRAFYYHDFCMHVQDKGFLNEGQTFTLMRLEDAPVNAQCDICYQAIGADPAISTDSYSHEQATGSDLDEIAMIDENEDYQGETLHRVPAVKAAEKGQSDAASHCRPGTQSDTPVRLPDRPADLLPASSPDVRPVLGGRQGEAGTPGIESDHIAPVSDTQSASQTDSATDQRYPSSPVAAPLPPDEAIPPASSEVPPASGRGKKPKKVDLLLLCEPSVVRARLIAFRGYALEEKGAIIDENKKIREWCEKHTADELDFVMKALESDPYWGKAEHRLHFFAKNFALETPKKLTGHVPCARPSDSDAPDYQRPDGTIDYLKFAMWKARHPEPISTAAGGMQ